MTGAAAIVEALGMRAHPEGGWYVETWRAAAPPGQRPSGSAILYLLGPGDRSHWHRLDADEVWQYSGGDALELRPSPSGGRRRRQRRSPSAAWSLRTASPAVAPLEHDRSGGHWLTSWRSTAFLALRGRHRSATAVRRRQRGRAQEREHHEHARETAGRRTASTVPCNLWLPLSYAYGVS